MLRIEICALVDNTIVWSALHELHNRASLIVKFFASLPKTQKILFTFLDKFILIELNININKNLQEANSTP